ncbi:MAG: MBL fold metallo-hydrolase [Myxococcota bacterium]
MSGFYVRFWGVRGSIPTPGHATQRYGGNTACIEVRIGDTLFILDGGSGLRPLGADLLRRNIDTIDAHMLFSHSHWDHIQGFPFFVPAYNPKTKIQVYGIEGDSHIFDLLSGQMQDKYFPVQFSDLGAQISASHLEPNGHTIDKAVVRYFHAKHPGGCLSYSIEAFGKKMVYSTDNELDLLLTNKDETLNDSTISRELPEDFIEFIKDADLLVADGQYTDGEYNTHIYWGHPRATTLVDAAISANVKQVAITHHDPMQTDAMVEAKIQECRNRAARMGYGGTVFAAREGVELKLA